MQGPHDLAGHRHAHTHKDADTNQVETCSDAQWEGEINNMCNQVAHHELLTPKQWKHNYSLSTTRTKTRTCRTQITTAGFKGWAEVRQRINSPGVRYQMVTELGSGSSLVPGWYMDSLCYYFILDSLNHYALSNSCPACCHFFRHVLQDHSCDV